MIVAADNFFDSSTWDVGRNLALVLAVVFWAATVYWVFKDARRRIEDPWLVGIATLLGAIPPFIGPLIYMLFRPPEYLEEVRERDEARFEAQLAGGIEAGRALWRMAHSASPSRKSGAI